MLGVGVGLVVCWVGVGVGWVGVGVCWVGVGVGWVWCGVGWVECDAPLIWSILLQRLLSQHVKCVVDLRSKTLRRPTIGLE